MAGDASANKIRLRKAGPQAGDDRFVLKVSPDRSIPDIMSMNDQPTSNYPQAPIASEKILHDRKVFFLDLKENNRGRFLKITEDVGGRRDTIMLPSSAFQEFAEALNRLVEFESKLGAA